MTWRGGRMMLSGRGCTEMIAGLPELRHTAATLARLEGRQVLNPPVRVMLEYLSRQSAQAGISLNQYVTLSRSAMLRRIRELENERVFPLPVNSAQRLAA